MNTFEQFFTDGHPMSVSGGRLSQGRGRVYQWGVRVFPEGTVFKEG